MWIRFRKKDKSTWPNDRQVVDLKLKIKNKATKEKTKKFYLSVWFNKQEKCFIHSNNIAVSIPFGSDKTKIYWKKDPVMEV